MALEIGKTYYIKNVATGKYLNVYGNDTVANERNVNVYTKEDVLAQKWIVRLAGNGAQVHTAINEAFALNIYTVNNNCSMYKVADNSLADSVVDFLTVDASQNLYRIQMMAHSLYLTVNTSTDNAYFGTDNESFYALWQLEEVSTSSSSDSPDYTGILARYTTLSNVIGDTASDYYIIKNIPDNQYGSGIEPSAQFHPACGLNNNLVFNESSDGNKIIDVLLNKYVKKVFGNDCTINNANDVCYYLYGERYENGDGYDFHPGVDVSYGEGKPVFALYGGEIVCNNYEDHGTISIKPDGLDIVTTYLHMKNLTTKTRVNAGEKIGEQSGRGKTSNTDYPSHLHFEVTPSTQRGYAVPIKSPDVQMPSILPYGYMDGEL